ncbi:MAG: cupin domain-containing protein [Actinomycetota bacterium]
MTSDTHTAHTATVKPTPASADEVVTGLDATVPYILGRDEGLHHHFLNHLATTKVVGDDAAMSAVEFTMLRGFGPPLHRHDVDDEIIVVLDGTIAVRSGNDKHIATSGAMAFLPHAVPHSFQVLSATARILTISSSAGEPSPSFDSMVAELGERADGPTMPEPSEIDPGHVAAVNSAHGIEVLGPPPSPLDEGVPVD